MKRTFLILALCVAVVGEAAEIFTWGGREAHPAVVNPVGGEDPAWTISLRGEWDFTTEARNVPVRNGLWGLMYKMPWKKSRKILVPGCWEAQGVGEPGDGECWDATWDNNAKPIRHKYMGEGWYRRTVEIPATWKGHRIWIKFGGVKAVGWVWVNGHQVALIHNYCGTEKFEITDLVEPGKAATVAVDVDNRKPSRKGLMSAMHKWGGLYRDVEIEATPQTFIDDAWVRGDFDGRTAEVKVEVGGEGGGGRQTGTLSLRATVEGETRTIVLRSTPTSTPSPSTYALKVPLRQFRPWSPEHPNLYWATIELLEDGKVVQVRKERFGVRKFEVCGREFRLNGKPFYVRGFGDDSVYPLTGLSPADREVHRAHLAKARAAGFNYVRLHTHCELPEYFEAADELGVMIQPELPYYSDVPTEGFEFDPKRDITELWRNYRRHPSFAVYSNGNEGSFGRDLDRALHSYVKAIDPDRLKINQDSHKISDAPVGTADFVGGPTRPWPRGSFEADRPFVTHEYLNLCVKSDSRSETQYTGVWQPPATRAARAAWLARFGLDQDWGDRLQDAQHALQAVWQKQGIESARADPHCDGHIFWTIVDVVVWNDRVKWQSAQGLLDPFWNEKRCGATLADFAVFNSPSCVLCDIEPTNSVFASGERIRTDVLFAHFGEAAIPDAKVAWSLRSDGKTLDSGDIAVGELALGGVRRIAAVDAEVPALPKPVKAELAIAVSGAGSAPVANAWPVWLFPKRTPKDGGRLWIEESLRGRLAGRYTGVLAADRAADAAVVIAPADSAAAKAAVARGQRLVTIDGADGATNVNLGWWWMGDQVGTAIRRHPALGDFPHDGVLSPLLFRILKRGRELPAADVKPEEMIIVGEGGDRCFLYLSERRCGDATVIACHGLDLLSDTPEGAALLDALVLPAQDAGLSNRLARADAAWTFSMDKCWSEKTSLVYTCTPDHVKPAREFDDGPGYFHWKKGDPVKGTYGKGMGDCALICGTALSGLVDRWTARPDGETKRQAAKLAEGLLNVERMHGKPGFVARGICVEDGRSVCSQSSVDQYTHWVHGLLRYARSGMADERFQRDWRKAITEVATFMQERCTPERKWNFGRFDGSDDPRGICTMWGLDMPPHVAARLAAIYAAAFLTTGERRWKDAYEGIADESLERSMALAEKKHVYGTPCYILYQAQCSFEIIGLLERDPVRLSKLRAAKRAAAADARRRIAVLLANPGKTFYGMCFDGELALSLLMADENDVTAKEKAFVAALADKVAVDRIDVCRAAHTLAALWRLERMTSEN